MVYLQRSVKSCEPYFGVTENGLIGCNAFELEKNGVFDTSSYSRSYKKGGKSNTDTENRCQ